MHHTIKLEHGDTVTIIAPSIPPFKIETVKKVIQSEEISKYQIFDRVCNAFNISLNRLLGKSRVSELVLARMVISYDLLINHNIQLTTVGRLLCRDHSTIVHYMKQIRHLQKYSDSKLLQFQKQLELYEKD